MTTLWKNPSTGKLLKLPGGDLMGDDTGCCCDGETIDTVCTGKTYLFPSSVDVDYGSGFTGSNTSPCYDCTQVSGIVTIPFFNAILFSSDLQVNYRLTDSYTCSGTVTLQYSAQFVVDCAESAVTKISAQVSHNGFLEGHYLEIPWSDYGYNYLSVSESLPYTFSARCASGPDPVSLTAA